MDATTKVNADKVARPNRMMDAMLAGYLVGAVVIYARLGNFFPSGTTLIFVALVAGPAVMSVLTCVYRYHWPPALFSVGAIAYVAFNIVLFSQNFGIPANWNTLLVFTPLFSVAFFYHYSFRNGLKRLAATVFVAASIYASIYLLMSYVLMTAPHQLPPGVLEQLLLQDGAGIRADARADRLYAFLALLAFGWFYSLERALNRKAKKRWIVAAAVFGLCFVAANSRTFTLCIVLMSGLYFFVRRPTVSLGVARWVYLGSIVYYVGCIVLGFNAFQLFIEDGSGAARARSSQVAAEFFGNYPIFGVGIPPDPQIEAYYVVGRFFSNTDLGTIGILYSHGVFGLALMILCAFRFNTSKSLRDAMPTSLALVFASLVAFQIISPSLWYGGGSIFLAAWVASSMYLKRQSISQASAASAQVVNARLRGAA